MMNNGSDKKLFAASYNIQLAFYVEEIMQRVFVNQEATAASFLGPLHLWPKALIKNFSWLNRVEAFHV